MPPPVTTAKGRSTKEPSTPVQVLFENIAWHTTHPLLVSTVRQVDTCVVAYMTACLNHHICYCGMGRFSSLSTCCSVCVSPRCLSRPHLCRSMDCCGWLAMCRAMNVTPCRWNRSLLQHEIAVSKEARSICCLNRSMFVLQHETLYLGEKRIRIRTSVLEEKATACNMLCCYADELKEGFFPYVEEVGQQLRGLA